MIDTGYFKGRKVTVVGLARSGVAAANLLHSLGALVKVSDINNNESTRNNLRLLKSEATKTELGGHSQQFIRGQDLIVVSPGVGETALALVWARQENIPVISEIELAWRLCPGQVIAVTGTNGKTTVTTLIGRILREAALGGCVCGNIGNPFSGEVAGIRPGDFVSLEVSSFQLEAIDKFKPKIALVLNLSRNHLDRYNNMQEYLAAKKRIFINQGKDDFLILNGEDPVIKKLGEEASSKVVYFKGTADFNPNQAAVLAVGGVLGIDRGLIERILQGFSGVEHRLEFVLDIDNVRFVNDSKSTTVDATVWALRNMKTPVILIAGGREKGNEYQVVTELVRSRVREMVLIGESREKMGKSFQGIVPLEQAQTLQEAVKMAFSKAKAGDSVLFSPMCKSFDMFTDFEDRGRKFKAAVADLKGKV